MTAPVLISPDPVRVFWPCLLLSAPPIPHAHCPCFLLDLYAGQFSNACHRPRVPKISSCISTCLLHISTQGSNNSFPTPAPTPVRLPSLHVQSMTLPFPELLTSKTQVFSPFTPYVSRQPRVLLGLMLIETSDRERHTLYVLTYMWTQKKAKLREME